MAFTIASSEGPFALQIHFAIGITIMFKNGLCTHFLPPANKVWGKVIITNVFTCVCLSTGMGVWLPSMHHRSHDQEGWGVCIQRGLPPGRGADPPIHGMLRIWSRSGRYASYSNAFLLGLRFLITVAMDKDRIRNRNHVINRGCE